jgi:hypothetical protein
VNPHGSTPQVCPLLIDIDLLNPCRADIDSVIATDSNDDSTIADASALAGKV